MKCYMRRNLLSSKKNKKTNILFKNHLSQKNPTGALPTELFSFLPHFEYPLHKCHTLARLWLSPKNAFLIGMISWATRPYKDF